VPDPEPPHEADSAGASAPLREGEPVLLRRRAGDSVLLLLRPGPQSIEGRGVIDLTAAVGAPPGVELSWAGATYRVVRPTLSDRLQHLRRRAQIVTPKDAQYLLFLAGVAPGATVLEVGAGSGALTIVLAESVGPSGRVVSYDRRADFLEVARGNVSAAGLSDRVDFRLRDVAALGFDRSGAASVVVDVAEPWAIVAPARSALTVGGSMATYTPTYNQLEWTVRALREARFEEVRSVELLERNLHVGEGGTRPDFEMLGHTGFLTGARWMGGGW
jgi:tRNA (adenine57-N1/adenine58-N1)-methyltransferase